MQIKGEFMLEISINGYFTENQCKAIKEKLEGKTFYKFKISWSNYAGNCSLIIRSDINNGHKNNTYTNENLKDMFIHYILNKLIKGE